MTQHGGRGSVGCKLCGVHSSRDAISINDPFLIEWGLCPFCAKTGGIYYD